MHLGHEPRRSRHQPRPLLLEQLEERCLLSYTITDLGTLPGAVESHALGINGSGQVVGYSYFSAGFGHAFIWDSSNGMQDLGTLGGDHTIAYVINDAGQVVGHSRLPDDNSSHAFLWDSSNGMQDLGTLGGPSSEAHGINASGQVVGSSNHAFLWESNTGMHDLGTLGYNDSEAFGINDSGHVVGWSTTPMGYPGHAFVWDSNSGMQDLGTLPGGDASQACGINASGQVVGTGYLGVQHAFLWDSINGIQDLGTLPGPYVNSHAWGINASGQVVGHAASPDYSYHAFLWESVNGMQDLNVLISPNSGWTLQIAEAINDTGQIVGFGMNPEGQGHAFLMTPDGGGAPRRRMNAPGVIDPAVIQVLESFVGQSTPRISGSVSSFQNGQTHPVPPESVKRTQAGPTPPTTERPAQDVLFGGKEKGNLSLEWPEWINASALDALALDVAQSLVKK